MLYTIVGNGCAETIYDKQVVSIDANEEEAQAWGDEWIAQLDEEKKDQFGDLDFTKVGIEEVVEAMPVHWNAKIIGQQGSCLFL